jgi:L-threonylcarbamoyladenylate synthase
MSDAAWSLALDAIRNGEVVAFPTDTVYGLGCDPYNTEAILKIYQAKGRDMQKALPLLLSGADSLDSVAEHLPKAAHSLARAFWPGALTLVVPRRDTLPEALGGGSTIGVRVPNHDELRRFISLCGGALAATSANLSGQPDALDAEAVARYFGDDVRIVIDGGPAQAGVPSTVVDCTATPPAILRVGFIPEQRIRDILEEV